MRHRSWLEQNLEKGVAEMEILTEIEEKMEIRKVVDEIVKGKNTARLWKRNILVAAAVVMIGIPAFGFTFPALAQHIPIIGGLFAREDIHQNEGLAALDNYSSVIDQTQTVDGISITLEEVYFDGGRIYAAFLLESEAPIRSDIDFFNWPQAFIDGREVAVNSSGFESHKIDDYTVMLVQMFLVDGTFTGSEQIDVEINIDTLSFETGNYSVLECGGVRMEREVIATGDWSFNFPVIATASEIVEVNQVFQYEGVDITLERIVISPVAMRLYYSIESELPRFLFVECDGENCVLLYGNENERRFGSVVWSVEDESGERIEERYGGGSRSWRDNGVYFESGDIGFNRPRDGRNQLVVRPYLFLIEALCDDVFGDGGYVFDNYVVLDPIIIDLP